MSRAVVIAASLSLVVALLVSAGLDRRATESIEQRKECISGADGVQLESTLWIPRSASADDPAPAVLVAHGIGAQEVSVRSYARTLAAAGYVVRTWASRGTDGSQGRVGIAAPDGEVADVSALIDDLATREQVQLDADGDPRVAVLGISQGGGVAILAAASDERVDVAVPIFAWFDLRQSLEPNGVLKVRWASELFAMGTGATRRPDPCGNLVPELCAAWTASASAGGFTREARELLQARSPSAIADQLRAPTLIVQGQMDSLFEFDQALQLAASLERNSVPVRIEWLRAGHDLPLDRRKREHVDQAVLRWLDRYLARRGGIEVGPRLTIELGAGRGYAHAPEIPAETRTRSLTLEPDDRDHVEPATGRIHFAAPPGGLPADVTILPGWGDITGLEQGFEPPPGQRARFRTKPVDTGVEIIGAPRVTLELTGSTASGIAFVRLVDIAPDGRRLVPRGLVTPVRVVGLPPLDAAVGRTVDVELPPIAWRLAPGHRLGIEVSSTDSGYVAPPSAATLGVSIAGKDRALRVPWVQALTRTADTFDAGRDWRDLLVAAVLLVAAALGIGLVLSRFVRRRDDRVQEPALRAVPISAAGLTKRFGDGRIAVDAATFTVQPGTIVGLVGPNGAGKTTTLRMLLGLVRPSDGFAHVFGQRIRPGVPRLARVGALVEGPGLVPHLTGRAHLERYWTATGRPIAEAGIEQALAAVGLTEDAGRVVATWSHGMRQRLGIAQALLGEPELVLLDEPANGLDPAQIMQLRLLVRQIAASGRSVLLSSHLLGELEQVCTHVVLMTEGRVLEAGTLIEVVGTHPDLETAFLAHITADAAAGQKQREEVRDA